MSEFVVPAAMVEAAARALANANAETSEAWIFDGRYPQFEQRREHYRVRARWVLAAALGVCEVREIWRAETDDGHGSHWSVSRAGLGTWIGLATRRGLSIVLLRRLRITTPAEPVADEGAPT